MNKLEKDINVFLGLTEFLQALNKILVVLHF